MIGKTIAHYRILEQLGEGGMGVVYKAHDTRLDRIVAIKFLPRQIAASEEDRERLKVEAQAAAALNHPNIATIHAIEEYQDELFIVMEYIEGKELQTAVSSDQLPMASVIDIAVQIAEGLKTAHEKGIVHRDIKSSNIMIIPNESGAKVKIMDFGLATIGDKDLDMSNYSTHGTAAYISPEQTRGETVDQRSDIWSFGVVLYEMLAGKLPFRGEYLSAVVYEITNVAPMPLSKYNPEVPDGLQRLVLRALQKDANARYASMAELLADLLAVRDALASGAPALPTAGRRSVWRQKKWLLLPLAVLAGMALKFYAPPMKISVSRSVPSVAILYLKNLGTKSDEPLSYGITQGLIIDLARSGKIRVAPMQDVLSIQEAELSVEQIAAKLRVRYVVDGSLQQTGQNFRLNAQLVDASSGKTLWADRLQAPAAELASLQGRLATAIANALQIHPSATLQQRLNRSRTRNSEAFEYFLRAKYIYEKRQDRGETAVARGLLKKAIALDSSFVKAWNALALSYEHEAEYEQAKKYYARALDYARSNDDDIGEAAALIGLGSIARVRGDYQGALEHIQQSLELARAMGDLNGTAWALNSSGIAYWYRGDYAKATESYSKSLALFRELGDRKQESKLLNNIGVLYDTRGEYSKALQFYQQRIAISEELDEPHPIAFGLFNSAGCYAVLGDYSTALENLLQAKDIFARLGDRSMLASTVSMLGDVYLDLGDTSRARRNLMAALVMVDSLDDTHSKSELLPSMGYLLIEEGNVNKAEEEFTRGLQLSRELAYRWGITGALEGLGELFLDSGRFRQAGVLLAQLDSLYVAHADKPNELRAKALLAMAEAGDGNKPRAQQLIRQVEALFDSVEQNADYRNVYWRLAQTEELLQNRARRDIYFDKAYADVTKQAEKIDDATLRGYFLANVTLNRKILAARASSSPRNPE